MGFGGFLKKALNPVTAIKGAVGAGKSLAKGRIGDATKQGLSGGMWSPKTQQRGKILQGAGQAMQGGGLGPMANAIGNFRSWKQQQGPAQQGPQDFGQGGPPMQKQAMGQQFQPPQLPGSQMQAPQLAPMEQPGGAPQMGGAEPSPWAPQPPKPAGGMGMRLGGRGGFMPSDRRIKENIIAEEYVFGKGWGG